MCRLACLAMRKCPDWLAAGLAGTLDALGVDALLAWLPRERSEVTFLKLLEPRWALEPVTLEGDTKCNVCWARPRGQASGQAEGS